MDRKIRSLFGEDFSLFLMFARDNPGYSIRYGFDTPEDLWAANPTVEFLR